MPGPYQHQRLALVDRQHEQRTLNVGQTKTLRITVRVDDQEIGPIVLATKALLLTGVIFWVRFSFPRLREDQLQKFAWKVLIPISLLNIAATAVLKVAF